MSTTFQLNGETCRFDGDPMTPLIDLLRCQRFMTGTKAVCREGFCGACTVHVEGEPVLACLRPVGLLEGLSVMTIEGASRYDAEAQLLQAAFERVDAVQCGMCFPGMVMSLSKFLRETPRADRNAVKHAMVGNICRCTGYERIVDAVMECLAEAHSAGGADV